MKIVTWVEIPSQEIEVSITVEDIRIALAEAFSVQGPSRHVVLSALSSIGTFLRALTDEQLKAMKPAQLNTVAHFLAEQASRFRAAAFAAAGEVAE